MGGRIKLGKKKVISLPIENPISGDDVPRIRVPHDFHVTQIIALKSGGSGGYDFEVRYSASADDQGAGTLLESGTNITNNTTGDVFNPPFDPGDPAIIPAGNWVWAELSNVATGLARPVFAMIQLHGSERGS